MFRIVVGSSADLTTKVRLANVQNLSQRHVCQLTAVQIGRDQPLRSDGLLREGPVVLSKFRRIKSSPPEWLRWPRRGREGFVQPGPQVAIRKDSSARAPPDWRATRRRWP